MMTLQKDTADPQLTEQLDVLSKKFDEAYNDNYAAALARSGCFADTPLDAVEMGNARPRKGWQSG